MKISELINQLEELKNEHGDIEVLTKEDGFGGYAMHTCEGTNTHEIYPGDLYETGDESVKEFFPEWDGDEDTLEDFEPINCAVILSGHVLYST